MSAPASLIDELRRQIDEVDADLLRALAARMALVRTIGLHKRAAAMETLQLERWLIVVERRLALGRDLGLGEDLVRAVFERIHEASIRAQEGTP